MTQLYWTTLTVEQWENMTVEEWATMLIEPPPDGVATVLFVASVDGTYVEANVGVIGMAVACVIGIEGTYEKAPETSVEGSYTVAPLSIDPTYVAKEPVDLDPTYEPSTTGVE